MIIISSQTDSNSLQQPLEVIIDLLNQGNKQQALAKLDHLLKEYSLDYPAGLYLAGLYKQLGKQQKATEIIDALNSAFTEDLTFKYALAHYFLQVGQYTEAKAVLDYILQITPENRDAQLLALNLQEQVNPTDTSSRFSLGKAYLRLLTSLNLNISSLNEKISSFQPSNQSLQLRP